jgi:hypothetical protein
VKTFVHRIVMILTALTLAGSAFFSDLGAQPTFIAHWTFNNSTTDISGNGFNVKLRGKAAFINDAMEGSASVLLHGSPDYVSVGKLDFGDQFTICAWGFLDEKAADIQTVIANCAGGSLINGFKIYVNSWSTSDKRIMVESSDGVTRLDAVSPEGTFESGVWNHVAVTIDRINGLAEIYYNGAVVTAGNALVPNFQATEIVDIAVMPGPSWFWVGMIDDVRIYKGLLTSDEINEIYDNPSTGIRASREPMIVTDFNLSNFPNPFNPETQIAFDLPDNQPVLLEVIDVRGEHVRYLIDGYQSKGRHSILWNGTNDDGQNVSSGVYLYRLTAGGVSQTQKMLLVR